MPELHTWERANVTVIAISVNQSYRGVRCSSQSTTKREIEVTYLILIGSLLAVAVVFMAMDEKSY